MLINKHKLKLIEEQYQNRIKELEEILCPAQQHDYIKVRQNVIPVSISGPIVDVDTETHLVCTKCKKTAVGIVRKWENDIPDDIMIGGGP